MTKLSKDEIEIIKSLVPVLQKNGEELTSTFYSILFNKYPQVKSMFDMNKQKSGEQPKALAFAILTAAKHIDNLENTRDYVKKVGKTHVNLGVLPEHYPLVGECLVEAIKEKLNPDEKTINAFKKAYSEIADLYIEVEKDIYKEQAKA